MTGVQTCALPIYGGMYGFRLGEPDLIWRKFVNALYSGSTHADLENATRFMTDR